MTHSKKFIPSSCQVSIFDAIQKTQNSIVISALAGSGKTTTIVEALKYVPKTKDSIFLAFNKSIVQELEKRVPRYVTVSTINSFGARMLYKHFPAIKFNENKVFFKALKLFPSWGIEGEPKMVYCYRISRLVDLMRLTLTTEKEQVEKMADRYGLLVFDKEIEHALQLYKFCYKLITEIDFTDQVFQVAVRDLKLPKFDYVFVDECQDLNKAQQTLVRKLIRPGSGRLIAVGDPNQAIYGFAGADYESFERIKNMVPNTVVLPLNECYRCARNVVLKAQEVVPSIMPVLTAPEGKVHEWTIPFNEDEEVNNPSIEDIKPGDWVLCRNLKPLIFVFRRLVKKGIKANIKGREIGENLINIIKRTKRTTVVEVIKLMEVERIKLRVKLLRKGFAKPEQHIRYITLTEQIEIVRIFRLDTNNVKILIKKIGDIFLDEDMKGVVLSTIHRSKGLEAEKVYFLNENLIPSKYAKTPDELIQEQNLRYVAITRAKTELRYLQISDEEMTAEFKQNNRL